MSLRELVRLRDRYPTASRMTRYRMRKQPVFPDGVDILGTEYHYVDELEAYEEAHRRLGKTTPKAERPRSSPFRNKSRALLHSAPAKL